MGLAVGEFPVFGRDLSLDECLGLDVGFGLVLELGIGFGFEVGFGFGLWVSNMGCEELDRESKMGFAVN